MTLKPQTVYTDLLEVVLYCLTRYFCLRGGDELCFALKSHFKVQYYTEGPDQVLRKIVYINGKYEGRYLSWKRIQLTSTGYPELRESKNNCVFDPFLYILKFIELERSHDAGRLFLRVTPDTETLDAKQFAAGVEFAF